MDAMLLLSKTFRASWSIGLATALLAAVPSGHIATAENMVGGPSPAHSLDGSAPLHWLPVLAADRRLSSGHAIRAPSTAPA